ncbi:TRAP transporter substrate-binding protein [Calidifontibacillus oryziterrae]|uniref:TRAP transporter substrate-binding protein n=1 Tax=Calidifontibacillus oryziterrae TaxID=1191699 RepID=UPI00030B90A8|nr:TRAP transporter substrate-binding protein [Calidifontibacillus oryziterrae]
MKSFIVTSIVIIVCFIFIVFKGIGIGEESITSTYDDEQEGLNEQIVINFSHVVAENTPKGLAAQKFSNLVQEKTEGKVKVEVFPNGELYSDSDELQALIRGEVEMIAPSFSNITPYETEWLVLDLPFLFKDDDHVEKVLNGEIGKKLLGEIKNRDVKGLAFWPNGFKQMTSNKGPLIEPVDFRGLRFRIMPSKGLEEQFRMLGARTNVMPFNQVYRNFETRYIDGGENTISNIYSKRFYTVQEYMTLSNHGYLGYAVLINQAFWDSLSKDIQEAIIVAMDETTDWLFEHNVEINEQQLRAIRNGSDIQIHELTEEERKKWIDFFEPMYKEHAIKYGDKWLTEILELSAKTHIGK